MKRNKRVGVLLILAVAMMLEAAHGGRRQRMYLVEWTGWNGYGGAVAIVFETREGAEAWVKEKTTHRGAPQYDGIPNQFGVLSYTVNEVEVR